MSDPANPLRRSRDGMVAGVCSGIARTFGLDVTLIRVVWVLLVLFFGTGILAYLICWVVIPKE